MSLGRGLRRWARRQFHCRFYVGVCQDCENWHGKAKRQSRRCQLTAPPLTPSRHGWLKHFVSGLETDPHVQYRVHLRAVQVWLASMIAVTCVFTFANPFWQKVSVLYLVLISLYANLATDYGSMSASMAAFAPSGSLPEIPLESAHYTESAAIRRLLEENTALTKTVAAQTALLSEIHEHVSALSPGAGHFPPGGEPGGTPR